MRIGQRLITAGLVTAERIDEALRAQVMNGGRLGTNLVERGDVRMDDLAQVLADQHGLAVALTHHFEDTDLEIQQRVSPQLAAECCAIPLGALATGGIAVATTDPLSEEALTALAAALGVGAKGIVAAIAPELRILYWLERIYGIRRPNRYRRTDHPMSGTGSERRAFVHTLGSDSALIPPGALAKIAVRRIALPAAGSDPDSDDDESLSVAETAARALRRATGRDRVGEIVLDALREVGDGAIEVAMILIQRDGLAIGWKGFVRGGEDERVEALAIPTSEAGIINTVARNAAPVRGLEIEMPLDRALWNHLGTDTPGDILAVPILLFTRMAGYLYMQSTAPLTVLVVAELFEIADAMIAAFERLVRAARR